MNVLATLLKMLYESLWVSLLLAFLFSTVCLFVEGNGADAPGWKNALRAWGKQFRSSAQFRHGFLLDVYTAMILHQTLLNRKFWAHPLQVVFGGWQLFSGGRVNLQGMENLLLFVPFILLLFWTCGDRVIKGTSVWACAGTALKIAFLFSLFIEGAQAVLHLGTLQISDIVYNTAGGGLGGLTYWAIRRIGRCLPGN